MLFYGFPPLLSIQTPFLFVGLPPPGGYLTKAAVLPVQRLSLTGSVSQEPALNSGMTKVVQRTVQIICGGQQPCPGRDVWWPWQQHQNHKAPLRALGCVLSCQPPSTSAPSLSRVGVLPTNSCPASISECQSPLFSTGEFDWFGNWSGGGGFRQHTRRQIGEMIIWSS